jgi:hypothetical protein
MPKLNDAKLVLVNPKGGNHYHIIGCWMIDSPDYIEIPFRLVDKKRYNPCACVDRYY